MYYEEFNVGMGVLGRFAIAQISAQFRVSIRPSTAGWFSVAGTTLPGRRHVE